MFNLWIYAKFIDIEIFWENCNSFLNGKFPGNYLNELTFWRCGLWFNQQSVWDIFVVYFKEFRLIDECIFGRISSYSSWFGCFSACLWLNASFSHIKSEGNFDYLVNWFAESINLRYSSKTKQSSDCNRSKSIVKLLSNWSEWDIFER